MSVDQLYAAQVQLGALGYDVGEPDGQPGPRTREAIRQFQASQGLKPTGVLTRAQFDRLMGQNAGDTVLSTAGDIPLTSDEMADLQQALADLGYDIGAIDGRAGRKTAAAVVAFLSGLGLDANQTPPQEALRLALDATGADGGPMSEDVAQDGSATGTTGGAELAAAEIEGEYFDWPQGPTMYNGAEAELNEQVIRRILGADTALQNDDEFLKFLLERLAQRQRGAWNPAEIAPIYQSYRDGTEFDKARAIETLRSFVAAHASTKPMIVTRVRMVEIGSYDFDKGHFPLLLKGEFGSEMQFHAVGGRLIVETGRWRSDLNLPMAKDDAVAFANRLNATGSRSVFMAVRFRIGNFKAENDQYGQRSIFAQGIVESAGLHLKPKALEDGLGSLLQKMEVLAEPEPASAQTEKPIATNNLTSWTRLGLSQQAGRVFITSQNASSTDKPSNLEKAIGLLAISKLPVPPKSYGTARNIALAHAEPSVYRTLFPEGRNELEQLRKIAIDPFAQEDVVTRFNRDLLPQLKADAPRLPVATRVATPADFKAYDLERRAFSAGPGNNLFLPGIRLRTNLKGDFPNFVKVDPTIARRIVQQAKKNQGRITAYYGFDLELRAIQVALREDRIGVFEAGQIQAEMSGTVTAVGLYEDPGLTRRIMALDLSEFVPPVEALPGSQAPDGTYLSRWNIAAITAERLADPSFSRRLVTASRFVVEKDEFTREAAVQEGEDMLAASKVDVSKPLYLMGEVTLGTYDGAQAFPITAASFAITLAPDIIQLAEGQIQIETENSEALTALPIAPLAAKGLVKDRPGRTFPALFKIKPVRAEALSTDQTPFARLDVSIEQIMLMDPQRRDRVLYSTVTTPAATQDDSQETVALELRPQRLPLNTETTALLLAKYSKTPIDEDALRALLSIRWEEEQADRRDVIHTDPAPWGRFFPKNYRQLTEADVKRLGPKFRRWTELRIETLPEKLIYENIDDISGFSKYQGAPAQAYLDAFRELGIDQQSFAQHRGYLFHQQIILDGRSVTPKTILTFTQQLAPTARKDVFIPLDNLPSPPSQAFPRAISLDLDIRRAVIGKDPSDGKPIVILDTVPTEVRWFGEKTAVKPRTIMATFAIDAAVERKPVETASLSILGVEVGMSQAQAETILREQIKIERVLELKGDSADPSAIAESARLYVGAGGTDLVGILYGPMALEPRVYAVARSLFSPLGSLTQGQVLAALSKKYGELPQPDNWRWGETAQIGMCADAGAPYNINWIGAAVIEGAPLMTRQVSQQQVLDDPLIAAEIRLLRRLQNLSWGFTVPPQSESCKPSLTARFQETYQLGFAGEKIPDGNTSVLWSWLFDHNLHNRALLDARVKPSPVAAAADIKL
ncbi:peptidoglycan-binding domain-containing protein [Rhizobium sp. PDO1-076]|uniref:peptidoglycan-binding domain-containing protein n=1 Tax=Rhizobium sp. PDO1-076 TaxID=1125979 RepID=UPI001360B2D9|nr:peptidoglycan-binding protein [Rhizobium sp. PDO1-076]